MDGLIHTYTDEVLQDVFIFFRFASVFVLLAFVLTVADLKFGIEASKARKEKIKRSRAVRRTMDKISSYILWILIAYLFGKAFGQNWTAYPMLAIIYGIELESIYVNYFAIKGRKIKAKINFTSLVNSAKDIIDIEDSDENNK